MPGAQDSDIPTAASGDRQIDLWATEDEASQETLQTRRKADPDGPTPIETPAPSPTPISDLAIPPPGTPVPQQPLGEPEPAIDPSQLPGLLPPPDAPAAEVQPPSADEANRWQAIISDYEREGKSIGNEPQAAALYVEIGRIWEEHLARPRNAAMAYQRAFHLNPRDPAVLHASRRLFTEVGNWGMVVQILQAEIDSTDRPERKATLLAEKGAVLEEKLKNSEEAQKAYRDALEVWPAEPLAISALERLHILRREYEALFAIYQRALSVAQKPDRRLPLLLAAAQLAEDLLNNPIAAIAYFTEILDLDRTSVLALSALRRLTQQAERWDDYIKVLTMSAESAPSPIDGAQMLLTAARVQHERLEQTDRALLLLLKALELSPEDLSVLREIEWIYEQNQRYDEVVKVLRREAEVTTIPRDRVPMLFKLGAVLEDRLNLPEEAVPVFEEAVALMPGYVPAKQALGRLYERTGRWQQLANLFEMEVRLEEDSGVKVTKLFKLAEILDVRLDRAEDAVKALTELLQLKADYMPARKYLERILQKRESWADLIKLYEQEAGFIDDRDQQIFLLDRIGTLAEERLGDVGRASAAYQRILELAPSHLHAIRTLARLATKQERWDEVLRLLDLEVEATDDQKEVIAILHRAGVITEEKVRDIEAAVKLYEKVLVLSPTYFPALGSLGRLYHHQRRWEDLIAMYRREIEVSKSQEHTISLLFRTADVLVDHLNDDQRAAQVYEQILAKDGENLAALRALAEIHLRANDYEKLVEVLLREAATLKEPKERAERIFRAAEIYEEKLQRLDRAAESYQEALRLGYSYDPPIRALVRIFSQEGLWSALSRALLSALEHTADEAAKVAILIRAAELDDDKLHDLDAAQARLEEAVKLQPNNLTALTLLERIAITRGDWPRAIAVAETLAKRETDPRLYAARQIRIASLKETQLDPPQSGAQHYRLALQLVPDHPVALRALEIAYRKAGAWDALAAFYNREALVTREAVRRTNLFTRAGDVYENRLRKDDIARAMYGQALELTPAHLPALRGRRRIAERSGDAIVVLECIQREGEMTADRERARELLFEAGKIHQDQFRNIDKAIETYESVLQRSPDHAGAFTRLEAIYIERKAWSPLLDLLKRRAKAVEANDEQTKLYVSAAQVAQDRLNDTEQAIALYREVLARDRMHPLALVRLGPLLFSRSDWDGAIDVFHRVLAVSKDPAVVVTAFKSLGIIYQEHRQDLVKCVQSFQAAVAASPRDTDVLKRLTSVYREAKDWSSCVNVLLRLAEVEQDREQKVQTLLELGQIYDATHDHGNALLAHKKALELDPTNQVAILKLSELYEKQQDWQALADATAAYVRMLGADQKDRAGPLHIKMADVFETKLKDDARAINALRYALEAQPDNQVALERLATLYGKSTDTFPHAVEMHRRLLRSDPFRIQSYHQMHQLFERRGEHDKAFVVAEILVFLRGHAQDEELFYHEHKSKVAPHAATHLSAEDHERLVTHPQERGVFRTLMEILGGELAKSFPADLARYELRKEDRHGAKSDEPLRRLADELAGVLGAPPFDLWLTRKYELGFFLENATPAALIVGASVRRRMQEKDQRFQIARQLERLKGGHHLLDLLPNKDLETLQYALIKMTDSHAQVPKDPASLDAMMKRIERSISSRAKRQIFELRAQLQSLKLDFTKYRAAAASTGYRAGLILTNDVEVAVRSIAKEQPDIRPVFADPKGAAATIGRIPEVRDLLAYAISEEYFAVRSKLGFSIQA